MFLSRPPYLLCGFDDELDGLVDVKWFRQIFERTAFVSRNRVFEIGVRGDDDDGQARRNGAQPVEKVDAAHARHADIGDQYIRHFFFDGFKKVLSPLETARQHIGLL